VLRNGNFRRRVFDPAVEAVGLSGLAPSDLRHTAASLAIAAGANVKAVQRMLGHASAAMTLDVYAGLFGEDLDEVADRLDDAAAASRADLVRTSAGSVAGTAPRGDFGMPADLRKHRWGGRDSNPRPRDYESPALTG
jgi:Phage integrase family